jgi:hypothetical protein
MDATSAVCATCNRIFTWLPGTYRWPPRTCHRCRERRESRLVQCVGVVVASTPAVAVIEREPSDGARYFSRDQLVQGSRVRFSFDPAELGTRRTARRVRSA